LLIGSGAWAVYEWLFLGGSGIIFTAGGFLALFGAYLIPSDGGGYIMCAAGLLPKTL
jgi:hypothetical protein